MLGFWYLLLLLIGVVFMALSLIQIKSVGVTKKTGTFLSLGVVVTVASLFLLTPGSSEVIANLLDL